MNGFTELVCLSDSNNAAQRNRHIFTDLQPVLDGVLVHAVDGIRQFLNGLCQLVVGEFFPAGFAAAAAEKKRTT